MIVTLGDFEICNGDDRTLKILSEESVELSQQTQVVPLSRAAWETAFPDRAVRTMPLSYTVSWPPCANLAEALMQSRAVLAECPKGGTLVESHEGVQVTYAQAWVNSVQVKRRGVSNDLTFTLSATQPTTTTLSRLARMKKQYVANLDDISVLTGGGSTALDAQPTADVPTGFQVQLFVAINDLNQLATFRLYAGSDETNTDPDAGDIIVRGTDWNADTNAKVWKRLDS